MALRIRIDEEGDNQLDRLDQTVVRSFDSADESTPVYRKPLRDVFNLLAKNRDNPNIKQDNLPNGIFPETLDHARSYLIARLPGLYADNIGGWPATTHQFLIDENLSRNINVDIWKDFGRATHTDYEGLSGQKDDEVWPWACQNGISAIITRDRRMRDDEADLGLIAIRHAHDILKAQKDVQHPVEMPDLPLLIQIDPLAEKPVSELMSEHKADILAHLETRESPYVFLTDTDCIAGPSYSDVAKYDWQTIKFMAGDIIEKTKARARTQQQNGPSASPS